MLNLWYSVNLWSNIGINMLHRVQDSTSNAVFRRLLKQSPELGKKFCDKVAIPVKINIETGVAAGMIYACCSSSNL